MKNCLTIAIGFLSIIFVVSFANAQTITTDVPDNIDVSKKYLIYLHGGIIQQFGAENAVSSYYGRYEYQKILNTFTSKGFHVISEVRPKRSEIKKHAKKVSKQIKKLQKKGVKQGDIVVVGASLGAYIAVEAALKLKQGNVKYVLLGLCSKYALGYYDKYKKNLRGNFLSIYEDSDDKKSCQNLFTPLRSNTSFKEIKLELGTGHGFLYRPYPEWILPLVRWINNDA